MKKKLLFGDYRGVLVNLAYKNFYSFGANDKNFSIIIYFPSNGAISSVRLKGLEPPRLSSPDPKSGAATNYATAAKWIAKIQFIFI